MMCRLLCILGIHLLRHESGTIFLAPLAPRFLAGRLECARCGIISDDGAR